MQCKHSFKEMTNANSLNWLSQNRIQDLFCSDTHSENSGNSSHTNSGGSWEGGVM